MNIFEKQIQLKRQDSWDKVEVKANPKDYYPLSTGCYGAELICWECANKYGKYDGTASTNNKELGECGWCANTSVCICPSRCGFPDMEMPKPPEPLSLVL